MANCKVQKLCGGCSGLGLSEKVIAANKRKMVTEIMEKAGLDVKVAPCIMAENALGYRNKVIYGFARDAERKVYSGLYGAKSHRVVNTRGCPLQPDVVNEILAEITNLVQSMKLELYNERTGTGLLRHVMIRYAKSTGQVMVVFVTGKKQFPSRRNLVNALVQKFPQIKTIIQVINPRNTSVVVEGETEILYGKGMIMDKLCGLDIYFSARAFYQIHHDQCEKLYSLAKEMLQLDKRDKVLDTYCGVGTIGLVMADACKDVVGVELNRDAVNNAVFNAKANDIRNIRFVNMDSTRFMKEAEKFHTKFDAIILDPPRAGTTEEFIEAACKLHPKKILYISCDPRTQARDLIRFKRQGYLADEIQPVDMFPKTEHVETLALLTYRGIRKGKFPKKAKPGEKAQGRFGKKPSGSRKPVQNRSWKKR